MFYKIGWPLWKVAARMGARMSYLLYVQRDDEAGVFVGMSPNLRGLVVEGESLEDLFREASAASCELLREALHQDPPKRPDPNVRFRDSFAPA